MAITKPTHKSNVPSLEETKGIKFICPVCKSEKVLQFPTSVVTQVKGLTTMSIAKDLVCEHQFQAFVDKNYMVRGYQRVDFEFEKKKKVKEKRQPKDSKLDDSALFKNLLLEGDYMEYNPWHKTKKVRADKKKFHRPIETKKLTMKEIYNEFWEFIDDDNKIFQSFIKNDIRRD